VDPAPPAGPDEPLPGNARSIRQIAEAKVKTDKKDIERMLR